MQGGTRINQARFIIAEPILFTLAQLNVEIQEIDELPKAEACRNCGRNVKHVKLTPNCSVFRVRRPGRNTGSLLPNFTIDMKRQMILIGTSEQSSRSSDSFQPMGIIDSKTVRAFSQMNPSSINLPRAVPAVRRFVFRLLRLLRHRRRGRCLSRSYDLYLQKATAHRPRHVPRQTLRQAPPGLRFSILGSTRTP